MREIIVIEEFVKVQTSSGFERQEWRPVLTCKACKKRQTVSPGNEMNASEVFIDRTVIFQTYRYPVLNESLRIRWNGFIYKIMLLDPQAVDNTYLITCRKEDE